MAAAEENQEPRRQARSKPGFRCGVPCRLLQTWLHSDSHPGLGGRHKAENLPKWETDKDNHKAGWKHIGRSRQTHRKDSCVSPDTAAAAAKSLQSCPMLCDTIDGSPPGSPVLGVLQARTLEWVALILGKDNSPPENSSTQARPQ